jgi:hypothetical protein
VAAASPAAAAAAAGGVLDPSLGFKVVDFLRVPKRRPAP